MPDLSDQYLVFSLRDSLYGLDAGLVHATFRLPEVTPVDEAPPHVAGVINLRGKIIPVLDLNLLLGRPRQRYGADDGMVVIESDGNTVGLLVNEVRDVVVMAPDQLEPVPPAAQRRRLLVSRAKVGEQIVMILDPSHLSSLGAPEGAPGEGASDHPCAPSCAPAPPAPEPPERERAELHRRSLELMAAAQGEELSDTEQVAVVRLGGEHFGFGLKSVREFSVAANLTPLPNCPDHVVGNMNLRGSILLVIDIRGLLQMPPGRFGRDSKVVVASAGEIEVGIAVDDIIDIVAFSAADLSELPASVHPVMEKVALGVRRYGEGAVTVLNLPEILKEESLVVGGG